MIPVEFVEEIRSGDRPALARLLSAIEAGAPGSAEAVARLSNDVVRSRIVGVTGPPGAGKSTLIGALVRLLRERQQTVAVLAIDPSSPVTGGALLGDRIRMQDHAGDPGVFLRSMASRGRLGGLSPAAELSIEALAGSGFDYVLVETVGVGQSEVDVVDVVDLVVLVVSPGWGDEIQAEKAGVSEVADIFVINKGDRPGVELLRKSLVGASGDDGRQVLVTTATTGEGVESLAGLFA